MRSKMPSQNFLETVKAVYITRETKLALKNLCRAHPDIKQWTFCDEAVKEHIALELRKRQLMGDNDGQSTGGATVKSLTDIAKPD